MYQLVLVVAVCFGQTMHRLEKKRGIFRLDFATAASWLHLFMVNIVAVERKCL